ncbi:flavin reductase family protein [Nocardia sp. NPDC051750]|uniref:flavin reductase family protein n=1 Tax=Nocardia sp. NPDC051750 TaxID=3364325 RepID=UPI00379D48A3
MTTTEFSERLTPVGDSAVYRKALGHVPTSVAIVTGAGRPGPVGMTVGSFTSVSLDPPLITFFVGRGSSTWLKLYAGDHFGVNILGHDQGELCRAFSRPVEDRFAGVAWRRSALGVPLLEAAIVNLECTRVRVDVIGDHYQVVGRVESLRLQATDPPLIFLRGGFIDLDHLSEGDGRTAP